MAPLYDLLAGLFQKVMRVHPGGILRLLIVATIGQTLTLLFMFEFYKTVLQELSTLDF